MIRSLRNSVFNKSVSRNRDSTPTLLSYLKRTRSPLPLDENLAEKPIEIFLGDHPYDQLRQIKISQGNSIVVCVEQEHLNALWRSDLYGKDNLDDIFNWLNSFGQRRNAAILSHVINFAEVAEKAAFSIECCGQIQNISSDELRTLSEVVNSLLEAGCNIAMADFALDIVNNLFTELRFPKIFQEIKKDVDGNITLSFNPNALSEIPNGQISMLGNLAEAGLTTIHTLSSTRRPVLHPKSASFVKVYAVAQGAGLPSSHHIVCIDPITGEWKCDLTKDSSFLVGTPAIMMINDESQEYKRAGWKGNVVLFAAHFSEIKSVDGINEEALAQMVCEVDGEEASKSLKEKLSTAETATKSRIMQEYAYNCVQSAPQCKKMYSKKGTPIL